MTRIRYSHSTKGGKRRRSPSTSPRKVPSQRRARETVDALLGATAHILSKEGYAALTTNRVAERAGVSIGSLYQYYPSKEALVTALVEAHADEVAQVLAAHATAPGTPLERKVRALVRALVEAHRLDPALHTALVTLGKALQGGAAFSRVAQVSIALMEAQLAEHAGEVRVRQAPVAAFVLYFAVEGALVAAARERPSLLEDGALEAELCDVILRYLLPDAGERVLGTGSASPRGSG